MTHRNVVRFLSSALLAAVVFGCSDNTPTFAPSAGFLQVSPLYLGMDQGTVENLSASLNGAAVPVTWATADATVATVSSTGVVTGLGPGKVAITATMVSDPAQTRSSSVSVLAVFGTPVTSGVPVTNVSSGTLARSQGLLYRIVVPAGATKLTATFTGGTGDGDIFVQRAIPPDDSGKEVGCHSWNGGNAEACSVTNPQKGTWYIFVAVYDPYAGATFTATVTP
jgi:carboxypeptidase T